MSLAIPHKLQDYKYLNLQGYMAIHLHRQPTTPANFVIPPYVTKNSARPPSYNPAVKSPNRPGQLLGLATDLVDPVLAVDCLTEDATADGAEQAFRGARAPYNILILRRLLHVARRPDLRGGHALRQKLLLVLLARPAQPVACKTKGEDETRTIQNKAIEYLQDCQFSRERIRITV